MSTRVSWIDPSQLQDLVGQLRGPAAEADADTSAWEVHTLPSETGLGARELGIPDDDLWLPNEADVAAPVVEGEDTPFFLPQGPIVETLPIIVPEQPESLLVDGLIQDRSPALPEVESGSDEPAEGECLPPLRADEPPVELHRIREKLQAIRERAIEAGLLGHRVVEVPAPPALPQAEPAVAIEQVVRPTVNVEVKVPDPIGDTGPLELDQVEPAPGGSGSRIFSPFGLAESPVDGGEVQTASPVEIDFFPPEGTLIQRLGAFAEWAAGLLHTKELLIVDDLGDVLWGEHAQAGLLVSALMASKAEMRSTALGASDPLAVTEKPISIGRTLIVVPCDTRFGTLNIGIIRGFSLGASDVEMLRKNVHRALDSA